jgi:hypothetical protein
MMVDLRKVVFRALKGDGELNELIQGRIYQRSATVEQPPGQVPYVVYFLGQIFNKGPSALRATTQGIQVWVHDEPGDYFTIDQILSRVKDVLEAVPEGNPVGFLGIRHAETSQDLWDDLLKHIVRFGRYDATLT